MVIGIVLTEVGITSQGRMQTVESEKKRKCDVLANELDADNGCLIKIVSDGSRHSQEIPEGNWHS